MLEIMACLQGLAGQLLGEQAWLASLLQQAVRAQAQNVADLLSAAIEKPSLPRKVSFQLLLMSEPDLMPPLLSKL